MRIRTLIVPAAAALLGANGIAFAQEAQAQQAAPANQPVAAEQGAEQAASAQTAGSESDPAPDSISVAEKAAADARTAAASAPPRTPEQAGIARQIAENAPERKWRTAVLGPAQQATVMYPQSGKKISDVSLVASVDRVNKLEMLDITADSAGDTLRMPPSGPKFVNETQTAPTGDASSAAPEAADAPAPAGAETATETTGPAPAEPQK